MNAAAFRTWVERYLEAWDSNDPGDIGGLFSDDAKYFTAPSREPWRGRDAIVAGWLGHKDERGDHSFRFDVIGVDGDTGFVRGWTTYPGEDPPAYSNLWVIRLGADGRATEFTEWWMPEAG